MIAAIDTKEGQMTLDLSAGVVKPTCNAVYAVALAVSGLITIEFLPVSRC